MTRMYLTLSIRPVIGEDLARVSPRERRDCAARGPGTRDSSAGARLAAKRALDPRESGDVEVRRLPCGRPILTSAAGKPLHYGVSLSHTRAFGGALTWPRPDADQGGAPRR